MSEGFSRLLSFLLQRETTFSFDPIQPPRHNVRKRMKKSHKMRQTGEESSAHNRDGSGSLFILSDVYHFCIWKPNLAGRDMKESIFMSRSKIVFTCWCAGMIYFFGILTLFFPVHLVTNFWVELLGIPFLALPSLNFCSLPQLVVR